MAHERYLGYGLGMNTLGIAVIACGPSFLKYSQILVEGINSRVKLHGNIRVYVITDQHVVDVNNPSNVEIVYINIPKLEWPEATLFRYKLINKYLTNENLTHIFYMDADLEVIDYIDETDFLLEDKLFCVAHPGYFNRGLIFNLVRKVYYPPWETSAKFTCALSLFRRKVYVAGGFWGGPKVKILAMCDELEKLTDRDIGLGLYARSYDESYLNWWVANNTEVKVLTPVFLFAEQFPWLAHLIRPRILAVTKDQDTVVQKKLKDKAYKGEGRKRF
jgi:hypothetical protein